MAVKVFPNLPLHNQNQTVRQVADAADDVKDLESVDRHLNLRVCDQGCSWLHEVVQRQWPDLKSQQLAADQKHKIDIFEYESVAQELKYAHKDAHRENLYPIAQKDPTAALFVNSLVHDAVEGEQKA